MSLRPYRGYKQSGQWFGRVPAHWETRALKTLALGKDALFIDGDWIESTYICDSGIRYITTGNVGLGMYKEQGASFISERSFVELKCTEVRAGDVLISRLNEPIGRACIIPDLGRKVVTSVDNVIVRPLEEIDRSFLVYRLSSGDYLHHAATLASGSTMQRISRSELGSIRIAIPPRPEQLAIARFLDSEVGKIDALIARQEKLIALLTEKRQAMTCRAVTRGLDSNVRLVDTGIPWIGAVPAHWQVARLGALFREVGEAGGEDLPILSVSIHDGVSDKELDELEVERKVTRSDDHSKYKAVAPGDLVYNMMRAWQGGIGAVTVHGQVSPAYVVARPSSEFLTSYVEMVLRTPSAVAEIKRNSRGITDFRLRLYWEDFKAIRLPLPPLKEQMDIAAFIVDEAAAMDLLTKESERAISLLRERRAALITASVTGQIDVRGAVPSPSRARAVPA